jgi:hypothetical protein
VRVSNTAGFVTSEPVNIVVWTIAKVRPVISQIARGSTNGTIRVTGIQQAARYRVQKSPNMVRWFDVAAIIGDGPILDIPSLASASEKEFYRIVSP